MGVRTIRTFASLLGSPSAGTVETTTHELGALLRIASAFVCHARHHKKIFSGENFFLFGMLGGIASVLNNNKNIY